MPDQIAIRNSPPLGMHLTRSFVSTAPLTVMCGFSSCARCERCIVCCFTRADHFVRLTESLPMSTKRWHGGQRGVTGVLGHFPRCIFPLSLLLLLYRFGSTQLSATCFRESDIQTQ